MSKVSHLLSRGVCFFFTVFSSRCQLVIAVKVTSDLHQVQIHNVKESITAHGAACLYEFY